VGIVVPWNGLKYRHPLASNSEKKPMSTARTLIGLGSLTILYILSACNLPASQSTQPTLDTPGDDPDYTSVAFTISAQLTDVENAIARSRNSGNAGTPQPSGAANSASETLPFTSTPLPTKTPFPSDTPLPSPTIKPSPTAPPTQPSDDPKSGLGEPTWRDNFNNAANWPLYSDEHVEMQIRDGHLEMTALYPDKWDSWMLTNQRPTDFYIEVIATPGECGYLDRYGLLVRAPDSNQAYLYGFSCDGNYSLRYWNGEKFYLLEKWTPSKHINQGSEETNRLGLWIEGSKLTLYANGNLLTFLEDDSLQEGKIGLFIGAVKTEGFTAFFNEIAYWEIP
jgi:hypothetical protein